MEDWCILFNIPRHRDIRCCVGVHIYSNIYIVEGETSTEIRNDKKFIKCVPTPIIIPSWQQTTLCFRMLCSRSRSLLLYSIVATKKFVFQNVAFKVKAITIFRKTLSSL